MFDSDLIFSMKGFFLAFRTFKGSEAEGRSRVPLLSAAARESLLGTDLLKLSDVGRLISN